ncbi:MAG TPA: efflux RND transporter permease subunit, partial [Bacilli bacterium]|nr:efflux RND transporter permease subunit [Bacilli bacterium]
MKGITRFSMKNIGLLFIIMLLVLGGGFYSVQSMKMENFPNVDIPYLSVVTVYPGATPAQVLADVGQPMEAQLSNLKGLKNLYVTSQANVSYVTMEFEMSKDMDTAEQEVQSALSKVSLPDTAQDPEMRKEGPSAEAIYSFVVDGAGAPQAEVQAFVEEKIRPQLTSLDGVSKVVVDGSGEKKVSVKVDPDKLKEHNLTLDQVKQALIANNISAPTGVVTIDGKTMNVQVGQQLTSLEAIKNVNLILVEQDMSGMTDTFQTIGEGMGQLGGAVGGLGRSVGVLSKSQELMQTEIRLISALNGLSGQLLADQQQLAGLQAAAKQDPQTAENAEMQQQIKTLKAKIQAETKQITDLQAQLKQVQDGLQKLGVANDQALNELQKQQADSTGKPDADKAQVAVKLTTLKLSDIADVTYGLGDQQSFTRINGKPAVVTNIVPAVGANVVEIVKQAQEKLDGIHLPDGYTLTTTQDQSVKVKKSVYSMLREAFFGALLAALVTMLFLRNLRATVVALLSIPLSILVTLIVMKWMDYSLNMMTLAGIAVAVGRVVDDSIVVIENLYRRILLSRAEERDDEFVLQATSEVAKPITSSTITTIAVFGPLAFVPGIVGKFFAPFAWSVVIALAFSLLIAISIVPLMSKLFLLKLKPAEHKVNAMQRGYAKLLNWSLGHKTIVVLICLALLGGTGFLVPHVPMNFFPQEKVQSYAFSAELPVGSSLDKSNEVAQKIEQVVQDTGATKSYTTSVTKGRVNVRLTLQDGADTILFEKMMRDGTKNLGDGVDTALRGIGGVPGNGGLMMVINGADLDTLKQASEDLKREVEKVPGLADVQTNVEGMRPQVTVN